MTTSHSSHKQSRSVMGGREEQPLVQQTNNLASQLSNWEPSTERQPFTKKISILLMLLGVQCQPICVSFSLSAMQDLFPSCVAFLVSLSLVAFPIILK